ncbi:dTDP-4-dehydrorhamnose reductase [Candidatus Woesearchaeota archaeon]|nr:dTDP-4-dehydrorhamnose reductase [Candidatus Woesearchaeota archaeon]
MNIAVIGSKGMLGTDIVSIQGYTTLGLDKDSIDITDQDTFSVLDEFKPSVVINCAAYTNVDAAEKERLLCSSINSKGVENLVQYCKKKDIIFVQLSTDYIFDGEMHEYFEGYDEINPINYYGKTKAEAEKIIIDNLSKYYIVRTAWLFGKQGNNFVKTILKLCNEKEEVRVVNDQYGCPTYTKDLAEGILKLLQQPYGIYHITNEGSCTWYDFALEIKRVFKCDCSIVPCTSGDFPREAKRPKYSVLKNTKLTPMRNWKDALEAYRDEIQ